jgi:hypothetical protein
MFFNTACLTKVALAVISCSSAPWRARVEVNKRRLVHFFHFAMLAGEQAAHTNLEHE